jgi:hypothetical protein
MKKEILKVGTMLMPLGFTVALVDCKVYAVINFVIGFACLLELIDVKLKEKNKLKS